MVVNSAQTLAVQGERMRGDDVRSQNINAALSLANMVKSSLGPIGLDKMIVDDIGDVTITNDGATILKMIDVTHPIAKILVNLSNLQDAEVGDGTTSVVILAAELLKNAGALVSQHRIHPTTIISGYRLAMKESVKYINDHLSYTLDDILSDRVRAILINVAKTSMSSKIIYPEAEFFSNLIVEACLLVRRTVTAGDKSSKTGGLSKPNMSSGKEGAAGGASGVDSSMDESDGGKQAGGGMRQQGLGDNHREKGVNASGNKYKIPVSAINILKAHGGRMSNSLLVSGYALNCQVASEAMPKKISSAKIALLDFSLQKVKLAFGVQVLVTDPNELEKIRAQESAMTRRRILTILKSGANVVLTTSGIDDFSLKLFVEHGAMAVRRCKKTDLKRIARATGGTLISSLASLNTNTADSDNAADDATDNEVFEPAFLGYAEQVSQERFGDDECILVKGPKAFSSASIILRGANDLMCDEVERAVHDCLCVVKRVIESQSIVAGGGAVEIALSIFLEKFALKLESRNQISVAEFAKALTVIPKTLAVNAAKDSIDMVAKLRAHHHISQTDEARLDLKWYGLDLLRGELRDNLASGVIEPTISKIKAIKFATEAAITILRIDESIKLTSDKQEQDPNSYENAYMNGAL